MKRICYLLLFAFLLCQLSHSQAIGGWQAFLSYYNTVKVAETNDYVFAVAQGANRMAVHYSDIIKKTTASSYFQDKMD